MTGILICFYLWSNQNADFPTNLHFFTVWLCSTTNASFLAQFIGLPSLLGGYRWCRCNNKYNRVNLCSLTLAFRNVLNYPIFSLGSKPSTLSDFAQMFKKKCGFFFFKWMSKAWQNTVQKKNAKVSTVLKSWLLAHFLLSPVSPLPKK